MKRGCVQTHPTETGEFIVGEENHILILEDDSDRIERFEAVLKAVDAGLAMCVWDTTHQMIRELPGLLAGARFISLDHDLYTESDQDPGDGVDVARFLAEQKPVCPVIIHSSNSPRAQIMTGLLQQGGWQVARSVPLGDNWIEEDWRSVVNEVLAGMPSSLPTDEWSPRHRRVVEDLVQRQTPATDQWVAETARELNALPICWDLWSHWFLCADGRVIVTDGKQTTESTDYLQRTMTLTVGAENYPALRTLLPARPRGAPDCSCVTGAKFDKIACPQCGGLRWLFPARGED